MYDFKLCRAILVGFRNQLKADGKVGFEKAGSLGMLALEFDQIFVLCMGASCLRHRTGYWPPEVHQRLTVFDARDMDRTLSEQVGPNVSKLLNIGKAAVRRPNAAHNVLRHRVLAFLATLQLVVNRWPDAETTE